MLPRRWTARPSGLQRYPNYAITVEGHADERGTREYNLALGARRASAATRDYLVSQRGVPAQRLKTISYGKEKSGRRLRRHFLLVAEPPRCHRSRRRRPLIRFRARPRRGPGDHRTSIEKGGSGSEPPFTFLHSLAGFGCFLQPIRMDFLNSGMSERDLAKSRTSCHTE